MEISNLVCVRDYSHTEHPRLAVNDGETHAVDGNGTFGDSDGRGVLSIILEIETPTAVVVNNLGTTCSLVNMTLDDMTVETAVHTHGTFHIDLSTNLPCAEVGLEHGLVHGSDNILLFLLVNLYDGKAAAIMRHALVDAKLVAKRHLQREVVVGILFFNFHDASGRFNDSCKHNS